MRERLRFVDSGDGWRLELRRYEGLAPPLRDRRPVLFVPGYGMNGHVLAHHPRGRSFIAHLVEAGLEPWVVHLRGQGGAEHVGGPRAVRFDRWVRVDLPAAIDAVLAGTATGADRVDAVGCSLGATVWYAHLALHPREHRVGRLVTLGGPLRWDAAPWPLRASFAWVRPEWVARVPVRGTRRLARAGLPFAKWAPWLVGLYMNVADIDLSDPAALTRTVDDPDPELNGELARWMRAGRLRVGGVCVAEGLASVEVPILAVAANRDGIVPPAVVRSIAGATAGPVEVLEVGEGSRWFAHADLFVNDRAEALVFAPVERWLRRRAGA